MAKKKEYSFADEAKRIMKRFPRRETDPIEKRDYEEAMTRLQQEQELARQELGLGEPQQMAGGGKMKYQTGGPYGTRIPSEFAVKSAIALGPALRGQNLKMPLADLTSIEPGMTDVTVTAPNLRRESMLENKYNQPVYNPGGYQQPKDPNAPVLDSLSNQGMMYGTNTRP